MVEARLSKRMSTESFLPMAPRQVVWQNFAIMTAALNRLRAQNSRQAVWIVEAQRHNRRLQQRRAAQNLRIAA